MGINPSVCFPRKQKNLQSQMVQLKGQRDELEHYRTILEDRFALLLESSIRFAKADERDKAILALRKKKLIENQIEMVDKFLIKLLMVISDTEMAQIQLDVSDHLEIGAKLLMAISKEVKNTDYDLLVGAEFEYMSEIAKAMGISHSDCKNVDDPALMKELQALMGESETGKEEEKLARVEPPKTLIAKMSKDQANKELVTI